MNLILKISHQSTYQVKINFSSSPEMLPLFCGDAKIKSAKLLRL